MTIFLFLLIMLSFDSIRSSYIYNYTHMTEEPLGCSQNNTHRRYYYEIPDGSSIRLPICRGTQSNSIVYWFSYSDYCRNGAFNRNRHFAMVYPNGTSICENRTVSPSWNNCRQNYQFTIESTIIVKNDERSVNEYVCSLSRTTSSSDRSVSYFIRFRHITEAVTLDDLSTSTISLPPTFSNETNTNSTSALLSTAVLDTSSESKAAPRLLIIVVSTSAGLVLTIALIIASIIGYIYYRRRLVQREQEALRMECLK